ncbi:MAG: hypothetical protein ACRDDZ_06055 [Marinifilaceae bacterium]
MRIRPLDISLDYALHRGFSSIDILAGFCVLNIFYQFNRKDYRIAILMQPISFFEQFVSFLLLAWGSFFGIVLLYATFSANVVGNLYAFYIGEHMFWQNPLSIFQNHYDGPLTLPLPVLLALQAFFFTVYAFVGQCRKLLFVVIFCIGALLIKFDIYTYVLLDYSEWVQLPIAIRLLYWISPLFFFSFATYGLRRQQV